MPKKTSYGYYRYSQDLSLNQETFQVASFNNNMRFVGDKHRKSKLVFGNLRNTRLSFYDTGFKYGKYSAYLKNIDTIYASQGTVSLDFRQSHRNVAIVTGSGNDFVQIGDGKVSVNMGRGNDILEVGTIIAQSTYDGGAGDDTLVFTNQNANATVTDSSLTVGKKTSSIENFTTFKAEKGNVKLNFKKMHQSVTVVTGRGNDTVVLGQGRVNVDLGRGDDTLILEKAVKKSKINGGYGFDTLELTAKDVSVTLTDSSIQIGQGLVSLKNFEAIAATHGDVTIDARSTRYGYQIVTGDGDDLVILGTGQNIVHTGDGDDKIVLSAVTRGSIINGGSGQDFLDLTNAGNHFEISDDKIVQDRNKVTLQNIEGVNFRDSLYRFGYPGFGHYSTGYLDIDLTGITKKFTVNSGKTDDNIILGSGTVTVNAGAGANKITMLGDGDHNVTTGTGDDEYYLANGDIEITDGGGDNIFQIMADGQNHAGDVQINLLKSGDNTFNFTHVNVGSDTKQWLEGLQFALVVGAHGSDALEINGLGKATVTISGVQNQTEGQINIYGQNLRSAQFSVDFNSVIKALEDGGQTKGLKFTQEGRYWVASVADGSSTPQVQPINITHTANLDLNKADSVQSTVENDVLTLAQAQTAQNAPITVKGKLGQLLLAQNQGETTYTYTLNANSNGTRADFDALGDQLASAAGLEAETFSFANGQDKAKIVVNLGATLPANENSSIVVGTDASDTLNIANYAQAKAVYGGKGNDVIIFGTASNGLAYGGLGQDEYDLTLTAGTNATIIEHGNEADTVNLFGASNLAEPEDITNMLNDITFSITTNGQAITLTVSGLENQGSFAFTESAGNFNSDILNFYADSYLNANAENLVCGVDLQEIVGKLQTMENGSHKFTFAQDTTNLKHYTVTSQTTIS